MNKINLSITISALLFMGCGNNNSSVDKKINLEIKTSSRSVNYLIANDELSLYRFDNDIKDSNMSQCYNNSTSQCATVWPPYYAGTLSQLDIDNGLNNFKRTDGVMQTAYFGYPLYKFNQDISSGDINGNFVHSTWHLIYPKTYNSGADGTKLSISKIDEKYMIDKKGLSLYTFDDDNVSNQSNCYNQCAKIWPPFYVDINSSTISTNLDISLFAEVTRTDGRKQVSYNGKPLYYFVGIEDKSIEGDTKAGDTYGDWFKNGDWHLVQIK